MVGIKPIKGFVVDVMATWSLKSPPFHNFTHATDTLTIMTRLLHPNYCDAQRFLYPPEARLRSKKSGGPIMSKCETPTLTPCLDQKVYFWE